MLDLAQSTRRWDAPCEVLRPSRQTVPLLVCSPHSGAHYPADFLARCAPGVSALRGFEDAFVDELFGAAPSLGAPLLRACFARAYIDPNREPFELDPAMFADPLPAYVNAASPRVLAGTGTIARRLAGGAEIYRDKLGFADALSRIAACYRPYHETLRSLLDSTLARFGRCLVLDCHSMPSAPPRAAASQSGQPDFVLGDCFASSCDPAVTLCAESSLRNMGYVVRRNAPYSGGFTTRHYGRPREGVHALQVEVNRALYMDERRLERSAGLTDLRARMGELMAGLARLAACGFVSP